MCPLNFGGEEGSWPKNIQIDISHDRDIVMESQVEEDVRPRSPELKYN